MQIEGTPNERALLVTFAYIAGFTAAFILFGSAVLSTSTSPMVATPQAGMQSASVIGSTVSNAPPAQEAVVTVPAFELAYENDGLYLYTDSEFPLLLSKEAAAAGVSYTADSPLSETQGFHTAIPHYELIAAQNHVFFCEQYATTGECTPFLFDIDSETLYVFRDSDGPITLTTNEARLTTVTGAGSYVLGQYRSVQADRPWEVMAR